MDVLKLTQKLISIPSYVDAQTTEAQVGEFVFEYLQSFDFLHVEKQPVEGNRYNIIAHDGYPPKLMFCSHMDTVPASSKWQFDPFGGEIRGDRLYGLGASDMKGGLACVLHSLQSFQNTQGLFLLFDVDEEYYFKGMLKFLEEFTIHPEFALFTEPGLKITHGHRGLIEVEFAIRGKEAHAARPELGRNAILGATKAVEHLLNEIDSYEHSSLGQSTCNLAWLEGGIVDDNGNISCRANIVPNMAKFVLDVRPAHSELRASKVISIVTEYLNSAGFQIESIDPKLDFGSLFISPNDLQEFESIVQNALGDIEYEDVSKGGYGEAQLLNEQLGTSCVYFGPGPMEMAHQADEYVSIEELHKTCDIYSALIANYCGHK